MEINTLVVAILIGGWAWGRVFTKLKLPGVLGMTLWGIGIGFWGRENLPDLIWQAAPFLKSLALVVILLRAGLGIHRETLRRVGRTAMLMAFVPCLFEGGALLLLFRFVFDFSWSAAGMGAFVLAAVSPAVVVPSMLHFKEQGYGKAREVPTMILAGASLDDVFAITLFSMFLEAGTGNNVSVLSSLGGIPVSILGGVIPGILAGLVLAWWFRKHHKSIRATEKAVLLLGLCFLLLEIGNSLHTAALLGIMTVGFVLLEKTPHVAAELAKKLGSFWVLAEIILFVLIGMSVDLHVARDAGFKGIALIATGLAFRSVGVWISTWKSGLNAGERLFAVFAYLPKATVQAAMGGVALAYGVPEGEMILAFAVMAIVFTAPLGLIAIRMSGPRLLGKES